MTKRSIANEILDGLDDFAAWRAGDRALRTTKIDLPRAGDVAGIRNKLGLSQTAFAAFMGVSVGTLRNWEQGRREPQGPARAFLHVASVAPLAVLTAFHATEPRVAGRVSTGKRTSRPASRSREALARATRR